ncbi:DUF2341 domain-containing protein, partial [Candidatus Woesearchaeota archaeon]|nr:DUF2341 domain-containing protein [Candidatus Woesearchaeota archaeon]
MKSITKSIILCTLILFVLPIIKPSENNLVLLDKSEYHLGDTVNINLEDNSFEELQLSIINNNNIYKYLGIPEPYLIFTPKDAGDYRIELTDIAKNEVVYGINFSVYEKTDEPKTNENYYYLEIGNAPDDTLVYTDKEIYQKNEIVNIYINNITSDYNLVIKSENNIYTFLGELVSPMKFIPKDPGKHEIQLLNSLNEIVYETEFYLGFPDEEDLTGYKKYDEIKLINNSDADSPFSGVYNQSYFNIKEDLADRKLCTYCDNNTFERLNGLNKFFASNITKKTRLKHGDVRIKDSKGNNINSRIKFESEFFDEPFGFDDELYLGTYDIEIIPENIRIKKMEILALNFTGELNLSIEDVNKSFRVNNENTVSCFAIDPSSLDFESGEFTFTASGTELWKCAEWNFSTQTCYGDWIKVMELTPGEEYNIPLTVDDPGFAEIYITAAMHLDENRSFISDIYEEIKELDGIWSEPIYEDEYVRVTFEQELDNSRDITLYPRIVSGNPKVEIYEIDGTEKIAEFSSIISNGYNKVFLTNLVGQQDVFDLRVSDGAIEIDHIIDPSPSTVQTTTATADTGTQLAFTFGSQPSVGNLLVAFLGTSDYLEDREPSAPDGTWTQIEIQENGNAELTVWWKIVQSGDGTSYTFTISGSAERGSGILYEIQDVDSADPIHKSDSAQGSTTTPSLTPDVLGTLALATLATDDTESVSSVSSGWTLDESVLPTYHGTYSASRDDPTNDTTTAISNTFTMGGTVNNPSTALVLIQGITNTAPSAPTNIQCDGSDNCNITVYTSVILNASGSTDNENDTITYFIEATFEGVINSDDLESSIIQMTAEPGPASNTTLFSDGGERPPWLSSTDCDHGGAWTGCSASSSDVWSSNANPRPGGSYAIEFEEVDAGENNYLYKDIDGTGYNEVYIEWWWAEDNLVSTEWCRMHIDGTQAAQHTGAVYSDNQYVFYSAKVSDYSVISSSIEFRFTALAAGTSDECFLDDVVIKGATAGSASETNTTPETYENAGSDAPSINNITITIEVDSYNPSASVQQSTNDPDLYLELYDGSSWRNVGEFDLDSTYTDPGLDTSNHNFSLLITDPVILSAWKNVSNQDLRITGIYMDYYDSATIDEINYTGVWVSINGKVWVEIGNHSDTETFEWDITDVGEQTCVDLRARAIDLDGTNTYSGYFTKGCCLNIIPMPVVTINSVGGDETEIYSFTDETPIVNATLNINSICYLSEADETFAQMVANGRVNCGLFYRKVPNTCEYTNTLPMGAGYLYMACNSTSGVENNDTNNKDIQIDVLCDAHTDCLATQYCDQNQDCVSDVITGYSCYNKAYGSDNDDEICQSGFDGSHPTAKCINDSTYIATYPGWYCSADADDCVYNDNGNSYDLNYRLCNATTNDYKQCSAGNEWGSWVNCAEQYDPANQTATASTHTGWNCSYYATAQTCSSGDIDLGSYGCQGASTSCNDYVYNVSDNSCVNNVWGCDVGCGAECDTDNSTSPGIINNVCYYDKSCSSACAWSQNTEEAPEFCIDDYDGGACSQTERTRPEYNETCYWSPECQNSYGANMTLSGLLLEDYCDTCDAAGNHSGDYSPAPTEPCALNCSDSGIMYYDTGGTWDDRRDDCADGTTTILSDTLAMGDVWNGSSPAVCNDTECDNDCGAYLDGACLYGECICTDNNLPIIELISPVNNAWLNNPEVAFKFNVTDLGSGIENCSLILNGIIVNTSLNTIETVILNFSRILQNGTYNWSIECYDNSSNYNYNRSENRTVGVDTTSPQLSNPGISGTSFGISDIICLNVTVTDTYSGIDQVLANINRPGLNPINLTLTDDASSCDPGTGNNIYSLEYTLQFSGIFNWTFAFAFDNATNENSLEVGYDWYVEAGGELDLSMNQPTENIEINESEGTFNYSYLQNCTVICTSSEIDCENVTLYSEYNPGSEYEEIMSSTTDLINPDNGYSCGNLSASGTIVSTNLQAESHEVTIASGTSQTQSLTNTYNISKAFITTQGTQYTGASAAGNNPSIKYTTVEWSNCNNGLCNQVIIQRGGSSTTEAVAGVNIIQSDLIDVYNFSVSIGATSTSNTVDISGWAAKPDGVDDKCFIQASGSVRTTATSGDCNNPVKIEYYFSDDNTVTAARPDYDGDGGCSAGAALTATGFVVCFNDDTTIYPVDGDDVNLGSGESAVNIGSTIDTTQSFVTCTWASEASDGIEAANLFYRIYNSNQIGLSRSQTTTTEGTIDYTCYIADFSTGNNYNAKVDQDKIPDGTIGDQISFTHDLSDAVDLNQTQLICSVGFRDGDATAHGRGEWAYSFLDSDTIQMKRSQTGNTDPSHDIVCQAITFPNETVILSEDLTDSTCSYMFNITSGVNSGNNTWPIRCKSTSENSATVFSDAVNLTINDHPTALFYYPLNSTWLGKTVIINASSSYDSDGTLVNYLFELDDRLAFDEPQLLCDSADDYCSFDTTTQNQCNNNSMECNIRVTVTDDNGLENSTLVLVGFDTQGPDVTLYNPYNFTNITSDYSVNASATDYQTNVNTVIFEYRENDTDTWKLINSDTSSPYKVTWLISSLADGNSYEVRAYANDTFGNIGNYDVHYNITIDRNGPAIVLGEPENDTWTKDYNITFYYNVSDLYSGVANCSLILNGKINLTNYTISEEDENNFTLINIQEKIYNWSINCTDFLGNVNSSIIKILNIDRTGPVSTLDRPPNYGNISGTTYSVNATIVDSGIGEDTAVFEYRENANETWKPVCEDDRIDDNIALCNWNTSSLEDGDTYQVRVLANDSLGNNGTPSIHTNIRVDNNGPSITLISPPNGNKDGDGNVFFKFSVSDTVSGIANCSLYINNEINQSMYAYIPKSQTLQFNLTNMSNGNYYWNITCWDDFEYPTQSWSKTRLVIVDIRYTMNVNISSSKQQYEIGNQLADTANFTTNTTDYYNNSIDTFVTLDIIKGNSTYPWWDLSWQRRKMITITNIGNENLTDFPAYLNISYDPNMQSDYDDLRFIDFSTGEFIELDYELEYYDTGHADVWVRIPTLYTGANSIYMYYNNTGAASGENPTGVWDDNYVGVWHISEGGTGTRFDSTTGNDGTPQSYEGNE